MKAAFIGLGAMGYPIAGHLAKKFPTSVWNRTFSKAETHAKQYGSQAVHFNQVAAADVIFSCVPVSRDVDNLAQELLPKLRAGTIWVDHTSGEPELARKTAAMLAEKGVRYLDAPLSGGVAGAEKGLVTVMVGGAEDGLEAVRPLLETYAAKIVHVGPVGAGHAVKAINNGLLAAHILLLAEGLSALVKQGVSGKLALEVINASSGRSNVSENLFPARVITRAFPRTFALGLLAKDLGIAMSVLQQAAVPAPLLRLTREIYQLAALELGKDVDHVEAAKLAERWAGVEIR